MIGLLDRHIVRVRHLLTCTRTEEVSTAAKQAPNDPHEGLRQGSPRALHIQIRLAHTIASISAVAADWAAIKQDDAMRAHFGNGHVHMVLCTDDSIPGDCCQR